MATTGVMRPGHVQVRVLDMDESVAFYKNVLGLVETGRDDGGQSRSRLFGQNFR